MINQDKLIEAGLIQILKENGIKHQELKTYLLKEFNNGNTEFRIKISEDLSFYIHPLNKNGNTFDSKL